MSGGLVLCPFCARETDEQVAVCWVCHRDIAIPAPLKAEHRELSLKRDLLRAELDDVKKRLSTGRRRVGVRPPGP